MNFEVGEKPARVAARARPRERAWMRGAGALPRGWRAGAAPAGGAAPRVERGAARRGQGGGGDALGLRPESPPHNFAGDSFSSSS